METEKNIDELLNTHFAGRVVRKDLTKLLREGANVPVYVLEYLLEMRWKGALPMRLKHGAG
jgi:ATP-dependent Lon protease